MMSCELHPSSGVCVLLLTVAATFPVFHHVDTRYTRIPTITIIVASHQAHVQQSAPLTHSTLSHPKDTAIELASATRLSALMTRLPRCSDTTFFVDERASPSIVMMLFSCNRGRFAV